jgi:tRNA (mo5U34)-methyltransferase
MEELSEVHRYHNWRQKIQLKNGMFTMGTRGWDELPYLHFPNSFQGMSFLDVGANDGLYSFLAEQRGAEQVTATDIYRDSSADWHMTAGWSLEGISLLRKHFDSKIDIRNISIYDLEKLDRSYDYVFCSNVLAWLEDPLKGLKSLAKVNSQTLHLREDIIRDGNHMNSTPALYYVKNNDYGCYYNPNRAFISKVLKELGYRQIEFHVVDEFHLATQQYLSLPDYLFEHPTNIYLDPFTNEVIGKTSASTLIRQSPMILNNKVYYPGKGWVDENHGIKQPKIKIWSHAYHRYKYMRSVKKTPIGQLKSKVSNCCIIARK